MVPLLLNGAVSECYTIITHSLKDRDKETPWTERKKYSGATSYTKIPNGIKFARTSASTSRGRRWSSLAIAVRHTWILYKTFHFLSYIRLYNNYYRNVNWWNALWKDSGLINVELLNVSVRLKRTPKESEKRRSKTNAAWILSHRIRHRNTPVRDSQWFSIYITNQSPVQFVRHRVMTVCQQAGTILKH